MSPEIMFGKIDSKSSATVGSGCQTQKSCRIRQRRPYMAGMKRMPVLYNGLPLLMRQLSYSRLLRKLCVKWNCVNNSNNLHKP